MPGLNGGLLHLTYLMETADWQGFRAIETGDGLVADVDAPLSNRIVSFHGDLQPLTQPKTFAAWLRPLFRKDWVVYAKPPFGGPEHVLRYLGRYTHRVAISNHRLVSFADGKVTFPWRDSAHNNEQKLMTLLLDELWRGRLVTAEN